MCKFFSLFFEKIEFYSIFLDGEGGRCLNTTLTSYHVPFGWRASAYKGAYTSGADPIYTLLVGICDAFQY